MDDKGFLATFTPIVSLLLVLILICFFVWHLFPLKSSTDTEEETPTQAPAMPKPNQPNETEQLPTTKRLPQRRDDFAAPGLSRPTV